MTRELSSAIGQATPTMAITTFTAGEAAPIRGTVPRTEIMQDFDLTPKQLMQMDGSVANWKTHIRASHGHIRVHMDHVAAVIAADRVTIFNPRQAFWEAHLEQELRDRLLQQQAVAPRQATQGTTQDDVLTRATVHDFDLVDQSSPFVLRALEAVFVSCCTAMDTELIAISDSTERALENLSTNVSPTSLKDLMDVKFSLAAFEVQTKENKDAMKQALSGNMDDLASFCLCDNVGSSGIAVPLILS